MTLIAAASAHGSPGVSTALQLVASQWAGGSAVPIVAEADPTGGVWAARYGISLSPGILTLAESLRKEEVPSALEHTQRLPSGVACVPLSPSATAAAAQLRSVSATLVPYLAQSGHPVFVDLGRLTPDARMAPSVVGADALLWFARPTREDLVVLRYRMAECPQPERVGIVLVGDKPYEQAQVEESLEVPVLHVLPVDHRGADALNLGGDDRYLRRSRLARSCAVLAQRLGELG